jgi:hypothetical protein
MSVLDVRVEQGEAATRSRTVTVQRLLWAMIAWRVVMQIAVERSLFPPIGLIQAAFLAVPAVLLARRRRHAPVVTTVFVGVVLLAAVPYLVKDLGNPGDVVTFVWNVVAAPLLVGLFVASAAAVRASRRVAV